MIGQSTPLTSRIMTLPSIIIHLKRSDLLSTHSLVVMATALLLLLLPTAWAQLTGPVDLTKHFDENTIYLGGERTLTFSKTRIEDTKGVWTASREFQASELGATHMNAPFHFNKNGWHIGEIPFERFFGKAVIVDLSKEAAANPDYEVEPAKLEEWEKKNGKVPEGAIVLLNFNWTSKSDRREEFLGTKEPANNHTYHFPGLSPAGAQWLVTKNVFGVGTDTASIDPGKSKEFKVHQILSEKNIYILEQAALNVTLPATGFRIVALPMKIRQGTGAPVRIVAMP